MNVVHPQFIAGIGASAGGIEALGHFFDGMPSGCGLAFAVVTHTAPHHKTRLHEILARHTPMTVVNASDGEVVAPDHVYVLPEDSVLTIAGNRLVLRPIDPRQRPRKPIDMFFSSLALEARENAIGVVLSGSGTDGALGIKVIKEHGGLTMAQGHNGSGPQYDGMPMSAIAGGMVDVVLPVERMGARLQEYAMHVTALRAAGLDKDEPPREDSSAAAIDAICATLRERAGHDFEGYKQKTFLRRIQRRMAVLQMTQITQYAAHLRDDPDEAGQLFTDLLIGVTCFFRDRAAFEVLAARIVPRLFENAGTAGIVRVWVPGCATGEEAYSLAILLREYQLAESSACKVLVFATDIDEAALAIARAGRYPAALLEDVAPSRIERFFRSDADSYVVAKEIREMCVFSSHSVIRDPPFSRMDVISCRNLLIYFNSKLQDDVLPLFHYALNPGGFLFLGPAENVARCGDFFSSVDKKYRIFQKRAALNSPPRLPAWISRGRSMLSPELYKDSGMHKGQHLQRQVNERVQEHFAPPHVVVEADGSIVHYSARSHQYLDPQLGAPSRQLLSMARKGLRLELRSALREAVDHRESVVREHIEVELEERLQPIRLVIEPLLQEGQEPLYLVVFAELSYPPPHRIAANTAAPGSSSNVSGLQQELQETRDRLQSAIEEYETTLEELKAGNEELVSVNEELQSTNEELETSREELQSINEELHSVNNELANKVEELHRANADLSNLFESTQVATVFLDSHLIIRSYTPAITAIFNLIPSDRGRPLADIAHQIEDVDLRKDIWQVLDGRASLERPVRLRDRNVYYLMRIAPYRTAADEVDGVLVTFVNITAVVVAEEQQRLLVAELNHRVRNMLQVVIGLANQTLHRSADLKVFEKSFMGRMQALARAYQLLSHDGWHNVPLRDLLRSQLSPFATEERFSTTGENVILTANAALALGLIFYELGTNAAKYGALSTAHGRIDVSWKMEAANDGVANEFALHWVERDGPTVMPPTHHGFGSELVQRQLRYELNGNVAMDFAASGLKVRLLIPANQIAQGQDRPVPAAPSEAGGAAANG